MALAPQSAEFKAGYTHKVIFTAADVTATGSLALNGFPNVSGKTFPAGTTIRRVMRRLNTAFSGNGCTAITVAAGDAGSGTQWLSATTIFTGATTGDGGLLESAESAKETYTAADNVKITFNASTAVPTLGEVEFYIAASRDNELSRPR